LRKRYDKAVWGCVLALILCTPAMAFASHDGRGGSSKKLDAALQKHALQRGPQDVIVTVRPGTKPGVRNRIEGHGDTVLKEHTIVNALTVRVDAAGLAALVDDPDVDHVSIDADLTPHGADSAGETSSVVSNLKQMLALGNWFTGAGITVAVIDSGIAPTADFSGRIVGTYDFANGAGGVPIAAADAYGHGTHVAGLIGASGVVSSGVYAGVTTAVNFVSLRVLNGKGSGKASDVIAALQFAVAKRAQFGIRVINLSLGHPIYESAVTDPLVQAVEAAVRAGIVVVVAAGNNGTNPQTGIAGYGGITSPGNSPSAITVGASSTAGTVARTDDRVTFYSSRGPSWFDGYAKPDVVAPGQGLLSDEVDGSTLAISYPSLVYQSTSGKLMKLSGSSMATGVVSGLVATMIAAHDYAALQRYNSLSKKLKPAVYVAPPALTPNAIKAMLQYSATPLRDANGVRYDALTQGAGEVDGLGSITLAYSADTSQPVGTTWMPSVSPYTQFGTDVEYWAQQIVWGTRSVSGDGLLQVNQSAWQPTVAWGSGELDNIVWGTVDSQTGNLVWGTAVELSDVVWAGSVVEGDNIVWGTALMTWGPDIVWGTSLIGSVENDNIVWGTSGTSEADNIVWGTMIESDNIVWGTVEYDNIVWGTTKVIGLGGVQ
jgi:serine protease AprX